METAAINLVPTIGLTGAQVPAQGSAATQSAMDFDALLVETVLRHGGLFRPLDQADGGGQSLLADLFTPMLARHLAAQMRLGLGELMMQSLSRNSAEGQS